MTRLLIPALLAIVSLSANAAAVHVTLGPETPLGPPSVMNAPFEQHLAGVASNGRDFLAIWLDRRSTIPELGYSGGASLYISRLDSAVRLLNPFGLKLRDGVFGAAVVWTQAGYMVLWSEKDEIDSMLLNDDGAPISSPKRFADGVVSTAASNGRSVFVIRGLFSTPRFASVFTPDGVLLSETAIDPSPSNSRPTMRLMVIPNGDYAFVMESWNCPGAVPCLVTAMMSTVSESGTVTNKALQPLSQWAQSAAAVGNSRVFLASMTDYNATPPAQPARSLSFRIFDLAGNPITDEKLIVSTHDLSSMSGGFAPSVGWDGRNFLVAWQWPSPDEQSGEIRAVRVTADGIVIDGAPVILSPTLGNPPLFASNGTTQLVAWDTPRYTSSDIAIRSASSFDVLAYAPTNVIPQSAALQTEVQLASRLAVWREGDSNLSIVASILGGAPVTVSTAGTLDKQAPAVGASSNQYLVVWREQPFVWQPPQNFRILAKRVAADGHLIDHDPLLIAEDLWQPNFMASANTLAAASDGADFLVVWPAPGDRLHGARVSASGAVLDHMPVEVSQPSNGTPGSPRIIWNGSEYVVAWTADPSCKLCLSPPGPPVSQVFVARVSAAGELIDSHKSGTAAMDRASVLRAALTA